MNVSLVVVRGKPEGHVIPIGVNEFVIGRAPNCHLRPRSELVSKRHCVIRVRGEAVYVCDLGSTNGTFVNNDRIKGEVQVQDGDLLKVGPLVFSFKIVAPVPSGQTSEQDSEEAQAADWLLQETAEGQAEAAARSVGDTAIDKVPALDPTADTVAEGTPDAASQRQQSKPAEKEQQPAKREGASEAAEKILEKLFERRSRKEK